MQGAADLLDKHLVCLQRISQQLDVLIQRTGGQRPAKQLGRQDSAALAALLPAIAPIYGPGAVFTSRDAIEHARGLPHVMAAVEQVVGANPSPRRVGKLFARAEGVEIAGLQLMRSVSMKEGLLWQVTRI